jgi:cell division protein FtsB
MISLRWLNIVLLMMFLVLQYRLWIGPGSWAQIASLKRDIEQQQQHNDRLITRNRMLEGEVLSLRSGLEAIEEHARNDLGMIKRGETFYLVIDGK